MKNANIKKPSKPSLPKDDIKFITDRVYLIPDDPYLREMALLLEMNNYLFQLNNLNASYCHPQFAKAYFANSFTPPATAEEFFVCGCDDPDCDLKYAH